MKFKKGDKVKFKSSKKYPVIPDLLNKNTVYTVNDWFGVDYIFLEGIEENAFNQSLFRKVMWIEEY